MFILYFVVFSTLVLSISYIFSISVSLNNMLYNFISIYVGGAMHFIYYINRLTTTKVDSTYLGCLPAIHSVYVCGRARTHDHRVDSQRLILSRHTGFQPDSLYAVNLKYDVLQ